MLIRPVDAADEDEWRAVLRDNDFGHVVAPGADRDLPVLVPTHFVFDGDRTVELHLARANPIFPALEERPVAMLAVAAAWTFIPGQWNAPPGTEPEHGVPTSWYAAVQATCDVELIDDPEELAAQIERQVGRFQPEGGVVPVTTDAPYGPMLRAIRGLRLTIVDVAAKAKFGGNRTAAHRAEIIEHLEARDLPGDRAAAAWGRRATPQ